MTFGLLLYLSLIAWCPDESFTEVKPNLSTQQPSITNQGLDNLKFRNYSIQHGLSQASVISLFQDSQGFMWLGTLEGINRFDGYHFKTWRYDNQNNNSISHNVVYQILEDEDQNLWIATHNGLNRFSKKTERFDRFYNGMVSGNQNSIVSICLENKNEIWAGTQRGLFLFDMTKGIFKRVEYKANDTVDLNEINVADLAKDSKGRLWIATDNHGLMVLDTNSKIVRHLVNQKDSQRSLKSNQLRKLLIDHNDHVWIGTQEEGLSKYNPQSEMFIHFGVNQTNSRGLRDNEIRSLHQDDQGYIWIGTSSGGLHMLNPETYDFVQFVHDPLYSSSIPDNTVRSITSDQQGNLFFGHTSRGFSIVDKSTNIFRHIKHSPLKNSLSNDNIWSVLEDSKNNIWIGTSDGLNKYNKQTGQFKIYRHSPDNDNSLSQNYVRYVYEDNQRRIWIGTYNGLNLLNPETEVIRRFKVDPRGVEGTKNGQIRSIFEDREGIIWIATAQGGLNKYDENNNIFKSFTNDPEDPNSISGNSLRNIFEDEHGFLWMGTDQGLNRFDKKTEQFTSYKSIPGDLSSLSHNSIQHLYISRSGQYWVCTNGGLNLFDRSTGKFRSWGVRQGMSNETVYGMLEDDMGNLWMSTNRGINKFDPRTEKFVWYDEQDGLQSNEFNAGAFTRDSEGLMYFGGVNGLSVFDPALVRSNQHLPSIVLTEFSLFNQSVNLENSDLLTGSITSLPDIILGHRDFFFAIEFSALNFRQPEKNQYAYKLEPFNKEWIYTDFEDRKAVYTNVPPGNYTFRVKASNDDGVWNEEGTSIQIQMNPPWWLLWWMKALYVVIFMSLITLFYRIRTRRLKIQRTVLKRMVEERTLEIEHQTEELEKKNVELGNKNEALSKALTDLADTQRQLIQSEKMASIGVLSNGVAHEINNPLNFIHGGVQGLSKALKDDDKKEYKKLTVFIDAIKEGVSRASKIVRSLNQFSLQGSEETEEIDIYEVIENCLEILGSSVSHKVKFSKDLSSDNGARTVLGSKSKCHQIIISILNNAHQATETNGTIRIETEVNNGQIIISITDNGCGISEENLKRVTDPFFTTKGEGSATGLGLYVSYNLIKEMEGGLDITSELGKSTKVKITLPRKVTDHLAVENDTIHS